ncbi:MAG: F0F1 ATP synthase subunit delta [Solirubrobacteraceae bacterium]
MEEIAQVYARALFEVASEKGSLDEIRAQLDAFADAMSEHRQMASFFFSPHWSVEDKKQALARVVQDADPAFDNFLQALIERHRMPVIFRIRTELDTLTDRARHVLPVQITSAIELDEETVNSLVKRIGDQTERSVQVSRTVNPDILGGVILRVGNTILDASIKSRLEQLRKQVARA